MKFILISFIKFYRFAISPLMGAHCRFHPTCSSYMIEAIETQGAIKGLFLGIKRILKCHPYYKGDFIDPVPEAKINSNGNSIARKERFGYKRKQSKASTKD